MAIGKHILLISTNFLFYLMTIFFCSACNLASELAHSKNILCSQISFPCEVSVFVTMTSLGVKGMNVGSAVIPAYQVCAG